jgi:erythromycin esterase
MKKKKILKIFKIGIILLPFFIMAALLNCNLDRDITEDPVLIGKEAKWLKYNAVKVSQIWPKYTDFSDLQPLKAAISNARIVMLGEQTHGDGTTFLAKVRLIKFLHQEMGFDVVAFESGLFDCHRVWLDILNGEDPLYAPQKGIFSLWSRCREVDHLFEYIGSVSQGSNCLEIAGFDCQFSGAVPGFNSIIYLVDDLEHFLSQNNAQIVNHNDWSTFKDMLQFFIENQAGHVPDENSQALFYNMLRLIQDEISTFETRVNPLLQSSAFWQQMIKSIRENAKSKWYTDPESRDLNLRDAQMADNFLWLYRNVYKDRKMIVWAATAHIQRNIHEIIEYYGYYIGWVPMGEIAWQALENDIYSIGFTGYEGTFLNLRIGEIEIVPTSSKGSLEYFMNEAGFDYGLIDFRHLTDDGAWLKNRLISRPLANVEMEANWTNVLDAMFFIRNMKHSTLY